MYLLDTHTLLWFFDNDPQLSKKAKQALENENAKLSVNIITFWEIGIKQSIGKLKLSKSLDKVIEHTIEQHIEIITLKPEHILLVSTLPFHHRDPFDRLLASHAIAEKFTIISKDTIFDNYQVKRLW